jgi:hypothetical protein
MIVLTKESLIGGIFPSLPLLNRVAGVTCTTSFLSWSGDDSAARGCGPQFERSQPHLFWSRRPFCMALCSTRLGACVRVLVVGARVQARLLLVFFFLCLRRFACARDCWRVCLWNFGIAASNLAGDAAGRRPTVSSVNVLVSEAKKEQVEGALTSTWAPVPHGDAAVPVTRRRWAGERSAGEDKQRVVNS